MIRAVPDVNVYVSAVLKKSGVCGQILARCREFLGFTSDPILSDLSRVMRYDRIRDLHGMPATAIDDYIQGLRRRIWRSVGRLRIQVVPNDPDDDIIIACALETGADYVISEDHHLLDLKHYHSIQIVSPRDFLEILNREKLLRTK